MDRASEGPTLSGSVRRPGVVDQPAWELKKGNDEEAGQEDGPEGLTMEERNHSLRRRSQRA